MFPWTACHGISTLKLHTLDENKTNRSEGAILVDKNDTNCALLLINFY